MEKIEALKTSATATVAAAEERDQAATAERQAAAELLALVVDIVRPSLRAIGSRVETSHCHWTAERRDPDSERTSDRYVPLTGDLEPYSRNQTENEGVYHGRDIALREDGAIVRLRYEGSWSRWQGAANRWETSIREYSSAEEAVADGWLDVGTYVDTLAKALDSAAPGLKARAEKARKNAAKLRAVVELLRK